MNWRTPLMVIIALSFWVTGCEKDKSEGLSQEHKALIAEFEVYKVKQCACTDFECSKALGQKIGPRIQEVMRSAENLPADVQRKIGALLTQMTECAKRTQQPQP